MATASYLARMIYKEHTTDDFAGEYKLLLRAKTLPAPLSAPNMIESTTLEDGAQTQIEGIKQNEAKEATGNLEKKYLQAINKLAGKQLDILQLLGSDGIGGTAKYAYVGTATATPNDVGGVDEVLEMTVTVTPNTVPKEVTDDLIVVDNGDGTFTVTKK